MASRIEQIIEEIEEYIDGCKYQALSSSKIIVNKDELEELLNELRSKTPEEIKRYQKIISNKDAILADAQTKADAIMAEAQEKQAQMVQENEVMQEAMNQANALLEQTRQQAQEILDNATQDANNIRMSAISYTDDMLANLEQIMSHATDTVGAKYNTFMSSLQSCYDIVSKNRQELSPQTGNTSNYAAASQADENDEYEEDDE